MKKIILILIFLGLFLFAINSKASAQEHNCMWVEHMPGVGNCEPISPYCPSGYHPRTACADFGINECDGPHPCDPDPTPTSTSTQNNSCCPEYHLYNPNNKKCCYIGGCIDIACEYNEVCHETLDGRGVCKSLSEPTPTPPQGCVLRRQLYSLCPADYPAACPSSYYCCQTESQCYGAPSALEQTPGKFLCDSDGNGRMDGIETAIGCISVINPQSIVASLLILAIGIGGGIAFLLMIIGAFQVMTSAGNPEKLNAGRELITSALAGLLLIIFSVFLLQLIGVKILKIPGF